jgi:hypothetical protein
MVIRAAVMGAALVAALAACGGAAGSNDGGGSSGGGKHVPGGKWDPGDNICLFRPIDHRTSEGEHFAFAADRYLVTSETKQRYRLNGKSLPKALVDRRSKGFRIGDLCGK